MTQAANLIRQNNALINNDLSAYQAAKVRRNKEKEYTNLLAKVDKLEKCVDDLNQRLKEMEENGCS